MNKLSLKAKTIISICLFVVVFVGLILIATFYDYNISKILTKNALHDGNYLADDFFGVLFEALGTSPIYLLLVAVCGVIFWWAIKAFEKKPWNTIIAVVFAAAGIVAWWFFIKDIFTYFFEHAAALAGTQDALEAAIYEYRHEMSLRVAEVIVAIVLQFLTIFAMKGMEKETLKKLFWWAIAVALACALASAIMAILKGPMGRMRFRAINSTVGQDLLNSGLITGRCDDGVLGYTRWYRVNKQPAKEIIDTLVAAYPGADDAFKSYPSGHTSSAAMTYALILLPDVIDFKHKKAAKITCWVVPIVFTMIVAISRIVVGAHYMSDVTFGGTLTFVSMLLMREIFICKGSHFFALFPNLQKKKVEEQKVEENKEEVKEEQAA